MTPTTEGKTMTNQPIDLDIATDLADLIRTRMTKFDESLEDATRVVLLNYGDGQRIARCITGDWVGPKDDLDILDSGLPVCPKCGKPCFEDDTAPTLAVIHPADGPQSAEHARIETHPAAKLIINDEPFPYWIDTKMSVTTSVDDVTHIHISIPIYGPVYIDENNE